MWQHSSRRIRIGTVDVRQCGEQLRQVGRYGLPQQVEVDVEVVVAEAVPHPGGGSPRDLRVGGADFRADLLGGLSDNLDELGQREPEQFVAVEVSSGPVGAVAMALVAASVRCRRRTVSSGRIKRTRCRGDLVAEVAAEVLVGSQLDWAPRVASKLQFHLGEVDETRNAARVELDEDVDIAGGAEVIAQHRAVQCEPADAMAGGEVGDHGIIHGQSWPQLHVAMMP